MKILHFYVVALFAIVKKSLQICDNNVVEWAWVGAITYQSVLIKTKLVEDKDCLLTNSDIYIEVNPQHDVEKKAKYYPHSTGNPYVKQFKIDKLLANTRYTYKIFTIFSQVSPDDLGHFRTPDVWIQNFTFAMSSCADEHSDPKVLDAIESHDPLFFLHMGDLHYDNINENSIELYRNGYEKSLRSPFGKKLLKMNTPVIYMWDDHDFGPDNSDKTAPGREAALQTYREYVPHYPIDERHRENYRGAVYQAFTIGRVRFIITDLRSERTPNLSPDGPTKSVLGIEQKEWFKRELLAAKSDPLRFAAIIWCSTMPWLDDERKWGHFPTEQQEIVSFLRDQHIDNLYIVSGDAHMIAVDDGSHSPGNMVVLHAAALGREGSVKGGPYSHGAFPGSGQFGVVKVFDKGEECIAKCICLHFSGRGAENQIIQDFDSCNPELTPGIAYRPPPVFIRKVGRAYRKLVKAISNHFFLMFSAIIMLIVASWLSYLMLAQLAKPHKKRRINKLR